MGIINMMLHTYKICVQYFKNITEISLFGAYFVQLSVAVIGLVS